MFMPRLGRHILHETAELIFKSKLRFTIPIILSGISKIHGSLWIYDRSLQDGVFSTPWMNLWGAIEPRWLYLFMAWDTAWYVNLAQSLSFARTFFPGYPFLIRLFGDVTGNYWLAAFMLSIILGFASLPLFHAIAEDYMSKGEALGGTIIMAFFPYIFLFTTVAYSESLFLVAALASWYFYLRNRVLASSLCTLFAILTKTYGILIVLPILLDLIIRRKWKEIPLTLIPVFFIVIVILPYTHKDLLNRLILEFNTATWAVSRETLGNFWFRDYILSIFASTRPMSFFHFFHAYALAFIVLVGYLAVSSAKIDWRLGVYSITMFTVIIIFGYVNGLIRYTSFIFPIWLNIKTKNPAILFPIILLFYIHSLILWHQFLWAPYPM